MNLNSDEIILTKRSDGYYSMKYDTIVKDKEDNDIVVKCEYNKVKIDIEVLFENDVCGEIIIED